MPRYFLKLSFDGTRYHGWQRQENAHTVQAEIEKGLQTLFQENITITGCGRTDTGVHAKIYYLHFDSNKILDSKKFLHSINRVLPHDIAVYELHTAADSAHARFDATSRTYEYLIHQKKNPFLHLRSVYVPHKLDLDRINQAANLITNYTDFTSFAKLHSDNKTNDCTVFESFWSIHEDELIYTIKANRFLRNMVRALVGTLIEIGQNQKSITQLDEIFKAKDRAAAGVSAPAHGLYLSGVEYPYF